MTLPVEFPIPALSVGVVRGVHVGVFGWLVCSPIGRGCRGGAVSVGVNPDKSFMFVSFGRDVGKRPSSPSASLYVSFV